MDHAVAVFTTKSKPEAIAEWLREDDALMQRGQRCSQVNVYLPRNRTLPAWHIANQLLPSPYLSKDMNCMLYGSFVQHLQQHLNANGIYATRHEVDNL